MARTSAQVHMSENLTTADSSVSVARINAERVIAFLNISEVTLYVESLAQFDELAATIARGRSEWLALASADAPVADDNLTAPRLREDGTLTTETPAAEVEVLF